MTENNIQFCLAQSIDVPAIHNLLSEVKKTLADNSLFFVDDISFLERHTKKEGFIIIVRNKEEKINAFCMVRYPKEAEDNLGKHLYLTNEDLKRCAHIESVAVLPEARGQKLQNRMIAYAEEKAFLEGYCEFFATVSPKNENSLSNFIECGYSILETTEKYGGFLRHILYKQTKEKRKENGV